EAVMISALFTRCIAASNLVHWRSTEFTSPDDQRRFKQAALLEIPQQSRGRPVGHVAVCLEVLIQIAVIIPSGMVELHESNTALYHPPCEQTINSERFGFLGINAVHRECLGRFL